MTDDIDGRAAHRDCYLRDPKTIALSTKLATSSTRASIQIDASYVSGGGSV
jgi:hypothetical protein